MVMRAYRPDPPTLEDQWAGHRHRWGRPFSPVTQPTAVAGRTARPLADAVRELYCRAPVEDGDLVARTVAGWLPAEEAAEVLRAMLRVEAELLAEEAGRMTSEDLVLMTAGQRRAAALDELARRVGVDPDLPFA
jgi:hypothetical protein